MFDGAPLFGESLERRIELCLVGAQSIRIGGEELHLREELCLLLLKPREIGAELLGDKPRPFAFVAHPLHFALVNSVGLVQLAPLAVEFPLQ
jgi:hypothetical protein